MVIKINDKPIEVTEDEEKPWYKEVNWMYIGVSTFGYLTCLWMMDFVAYTFLGTHPFGWIVWMGKIFHGIGVFLSWF